MKIRFLTVAYSELDEAVEYYNNEREGLGYEFANEVRRSLGRIKKHPEAWPQLSERTRRCRTDRFPYGIIYHIRPDHILVVGVMHAKRDPLSWQDRIK